MIHLNSSNRDVNRFPLRSQFHTSINETQTENDSRRNLKLNSSVFHCFEWIGNSENNNPLSSIKNDTFLTKIIPISSIKCIVIPANERIEKKMNQKNYFKDLELYFDFTRKHATVVSYDHKTQTVTVNQPIFQYFFEHINFEDYKDKNLEEFYRDGYFLNHSFSCGNNFIILGNESSYSNLVVENVTKRWRSKVTVRNGKVFLNTVGDYELLDTYVVYQNIKSQERLFSYSFSTSSLYSITLTDSIRHIDSESFLVGVFDKDTHDKKFYKILQVNQETQEITFSKAILSSLSSDRHVFTLIPVEQNFSVIDIDPKLYSKSVLLKLRTLSIPTKLLKNNMDVKDISFLSIRINKNLVLQKLVSNIPHMESSFICFPSNAITNDYTTFTSSQYVPLREIFRHRLDFTILLPNNKILEFLETDIEKEENFDENILIYKINDIISVVFEIYSQ